MAKNLVLGAGIAGVSAAYHLKEAHMDALIIERDESWGGLCDNFVIDGFRFDTFVHLSFTNNKYVRSLFEKGTDYLTHKPIAMNYYKGYWLKHPAQNNLFNLEAKEKVDIIKDFINRVDKEVEDISDYEEWLRVQYGDYFAENFPMNYTQKYWTVEARELETKWVGKRMYKTTIEEVLEGAMTEETPNTYYAKEMRYPAKGGYKSFLSYMAKDLDIKFNSEVVSIDIEKRQVECKNGCVEGYDRLISSLPLPEICSMIKDIPEDVLEASKQLKYTSGAIISLGFNKVDIPKALWYYIYDLDVVSARMYSPSMKSIDNAPDGCSSLQAELYFSDNKPFEKELNDLLKDEINKYINMGLFEKEDLVVKDIRLEKYANVIFNHDIYANREIVTNYMEKQGIESIGRFGEWKYYWTDQSMMSGKKAVDRIIESTK